MQVLSVRARSLPLVHLRLLTGAGGQHAPPDLPGLPSLTAALMDEGTARRSGPELAAEIERLGGYLGTGAGWDAGVVETEVLVKDLDLGLGLIAEVAREPSFPDREVGRLRRQFQAEIARRRAEPSAVASEHFERSLYRGTVYDTPLVGTEAALARMERSSIVGFHARHVAPMDSTLVAVGDVETDRLVAAAEAAFDGWTGVGVEAPRIDTAPAADFRLELVDRPGAAQTEIRVGHLGIPRSHPRYIQAAVLNCLLGGKFTSRLNLNLRETHGYTYSVTSAFGKRIGRAPFVIAMAVANEHVGAALGETLGEIRRLQDKVVGEAEVADTRDYLIGSFPYSVETLRGVAARLSDLAIYDLPEDYFAEYPRTVASISGDVLLETARELLAPECALVVCVGPAEELRAQLEARFDTPATVLRPAAPELDG